MNDEIGDRTRRPRAVFARHAASLLVARGGDGDRPEVLMGLRGGGHRFMPNRLVFPGGAVDPGDAEAAADTEPTPALLAALTRRARPRLARALALCAARELEEETGLTLGAAPGRPPRLDGLRFLCRAVTPPRSPIRFNARFLVVDADAVRGEMRDTEELGGLAFRKVDEVMGLAELALVTREVLERFRAWWGSRGGDDAPGPPMAFIRQAWRVER